MCGLANNFDECFGELALNENLIAFSALCWQNSLWYRCQVLNVVIASHPVRCLDLSSSSDLKTESGGVIQTFFLFSLSSALFYHSFSIALFVLCFKMMQAYTLRPPFQGSTSRS